MTLCAREVQLCLLQPVHIAKVSGSPWRWSLTSPDWEATVSQTRRTSASTRRNPPPLENGKAGSRNACRYTPPPLLRLVLTP
eukprot:4862357-Pyramimonas_sp.AAC.1